jgi:hypothetical protein
MSVSGDIPPAAATTAMLVINSRLGPVLCPFFAKCDGVLLIDPTNGSAEFHRHNRSDAKSLCDLILALNPRALVCGFIGEAEKQRLHNAGIDIRLGSCNCTVDELVAGFHDLPAA